ncbi:hypothetical protein IMY05_002G0128100 [Salix suchowensis]|nr:hypothetical protein IMY05_002G0124700 [Salix suchowensis]KAG5251435.1 hypothetical protein IMY05_002G0128100 [Salix suchowensis]
MSLHHINLRTSFGFFDRWHHHYNVAEKVSTPPNQLPPLVITLLHYYSLLSVSQPSLYLEARSV